MGVLRLAAIVAASALFTLVASPSQAAVPLSVVQDDLQLLRSGPAARERALDDAASLGADVVRILIVWRDVAARPVDALTELDAAVAGAHRRGLRVLLNPSGPGPDGASTCRPRRGVCAPRPAAYADWVAALGRRYRTVRDWSLWNEPNNPNWLQPQRAPDGRSHSPALYRELVRAGVSGLRRSGHARDLVLAGETAPMPAARSRPPARRPVAAGAFLTSLLAGSRPLGVIGIAHHPYASDLRSPFGERQAAQFTLAGLGRLRALVAGAARRGVLPAGAPVWLTEFGFQTDPPDDAFGIAPARQAEWLARAELRARDAGAAALGQYLLVDERPLASFQSGLRYADGRRKPAYAAYRLPLVAERRGAVVVLRGRVRPVARAGVAVRVERRSGPGATAGVPIATMTRAGGTVRVVLARRGGQARLAWTAPDGTAHAGAWVALR